MTASTVLRPARTRVCRVGVEYQAQCSCGWRGPNQMIESRARDDQGAHKDAGLHRGIHAGPWMQGQQWGPICDIRQDLSVLVFDPPNVLWPAGGQRVRMEDYDTARPMLAVEGFDRVITRHGMRREVPS